MRFGSQNWTSYEEGLRLQKRYFHAYFESVCNSDTKPVTLLCIRQNYGIEEQTISTDPYNWRQLEIVCNNVNKGAFGLTCEIGKCILSRNIIHKRSALLWDITQRMVVIRYRRFGTTYRSHLPGSFWIYWSLKIETIFCSASNAHAPHCHLWSVPLYGIFPWYLIKGTTF